LGIGASNAETRANTAPVITIAGRRARRVRVGPPVTLVVTMSDDGLSDAIERRVA
jgi:hypothetical protein